jgi:hypothetical protein
VQITINEGTPDFDPGSYEMVLVGLDRKIIEAWATASDKFGKPDNGDRYIWTWADPVDREATIESYTRTSTGPKSNFFANLVALLGPEMAATVKELNSDDLLERHAVVTIVLNEKGYSVVEKIGPVPTKSRPRPKPIEPIDDPEAEQALPF